jgi:hypothetical protein
MTSASSALALSLTEDQVKSLPLVAIAGVILIGLVLIKLVTSMIMRVVFLVIMVAVAPTLWAQRGKALDQLDKVSKKCDATFFGIHVDSSDPNVKKLCDAAAQVKQSVPKN